MGTKRTSTSDSGKQAGGDKFDSSKMLHKLLNNQEKTQRFKSVHVLQLLRAVKETLLNDDTLVHVRPPATVIGDVYGHYACLWRLLRMAAFPPSSSNRYVLLGNYADRGNHGPESLLLCLALKQHYPQYVYLLRGNHECEAIANVYGLKSMLCDRRRYSDQVWREVCNVYNSMPLAAVVGGKVFCTHGGLSECIEQRGGLSNISAIERPVDVPHTGLIVDLLWACPTDNNELAYTIADNGIAKRFAPHQIDNFCANNNIELVVRALQIVRNGFLFWPTPKLLTLFSAVNMNGDFTNAAAILSIDADLKCTVKRYALLTTLEDDGDATEAPSKGEHNTAAAHSNDKHNDQ